MEDKKIKDQKYSDDKILIQNSFYSFLNTYGNFFFFLIITVLIARLVGEEEWDHFIIINSYILIITIILSFFPPGLQRTLHYYLPKYISLKDNNNLKILIKTSLVSKFIFLLPIFFISLLVFYFFQDSFTIILQKENVNLLFLISPLIIIISMELVLNSINEGFNKYHILFFLLLIKYFLYIGSLLLVFLYVGDLDLELIVIINVLTFSIPFMINFLYVLSLYFKIKKSTQIPILHSEQFKNILKYGIPVRGARFLSEIWGEIQTISIAAFDRDYVSGFYIAKTYLSVTSNAINTFTSPLTVSFSSLIAKNQKEKVISIYKLIVKYSLLFFLLLTGLMFIATDCILYIFGEEYRQYSFIVKIYLFSFLFLSFASPFDSLMLAENKGTIILYLRIIGLILRLPLFLILLISYGTIPAICGVILSNLIFGIIYLIFNKKVGKIDLNIKQIILQYLIFFISLTLIYILKILILDDIELYIFKSSNLKLFYHLSPLSLLLFFCIFLFLNIILKVILIEDIEKLKKIFQKQPLINKILAVILKILRVITRQKK